MEDKMIPEKIGNWTKGQEFDARSGEFFEKVNPANGRTLCRVARSKASDVGEAVEAAKLAQPQWAQTPPVQRGMLLHRIVDRMQELHQDIARIVSLETGKSYEDARGETFGAIELGLFYASEGQRLYGRTTTSGVPKKWDKDFRGALNLANDSPYGLTACIHKRSIDRVMEFVEKVQAGVAVVNAGTYASEAHMPFGGFRQSGNGWREPGTEALDVYSELKDIYLNVDPEKL